jgi:hypothetical protein
MCLGVCWLVVSLWYSGIFRRQSKDEVTCALDRKKNSVVGLASAISLLSFFSLLSPSLLCRSGLDGYTWLEYRRPDLSMDVLVLVCETELEYGSRSSAACCRSVDSTLLLDSCWILGGSSTCASLDYARRVVWESLAWLQYCKNSDILTSGFCDILTSGC